MDDSQDISTSKFLSKKFVEVQESMFCGISMSGPKADAYPYFESRHDSVDYSLIELLSGS